MMMCTFGMAPSTLSVLPDNRTMAGGLPAGSIMDYVPVVNIAPFGMCMSPSNPTVAAATAAAMGVLRPMPCVPVTAAPWAPGSPTVMIGGMTALNSTCPCDCSWGGAISVTFPGQVETSVG